MESLTAKVLEFQRSGSGLEGLAVALAPRIHRFPRRVLGWDEDACGDFYLYFRPRLKRLLERFRDLGRPFESYLASVLHWQLRTFALRKLAADRAWETALRLDPPGSCASAASDEMEQGSAPAALTPATRRSLLFLALKCSRELDPGRLELTARIAGVDPHRLEVMRRTLLAGREPAERRLEQLRERRNSAFCQCRLLEEELAGCVDDERAGALRARLNRCRQRMRSAADRMARVHRDPTNGEVAALLGIPKGTVDSGLYWLKRRYAQGYDPERERSA